MFCFYTKISLKTQSFSYTIATAYFVQVGKMTAVNHPCIVRCYGMLEPTPGIVLELVEGSSLFQIVHGERGESFTMVLIRANLSFD